MTNTSHGAYPGAAILIHDEARWRDYIVNALAETVLLKDILLSHQINKPALLRQLYALATHWGQIVESCVGAYLWNLCFQEGGELYYWNEQSKEVDFVLKKNNKVIAIEVKSRHKTRHLKSLEAFHKKHTPDETLVVGGESIPLADFLKMTF